MDNYRQVLAIVDGKSRTLIVGATTDKDENGGTWVKSYTFSEGEEPSALWVLARAIVDMGQAPWEPGMPQAFIKGPSLEGTGRGKALRKIEKDLSPIGFVPVFGLQAPANVQMAETFLEHLFTNPDAMKDAVRDMQRRAPSRLAMAESPNASQKDVEKSLSRGMSKANVRHAKDKLVKSLVVKPNTTKAAEYCKGWQTRNWFIYSLKYSKGFVIVDHHGDEVAQVYPGIGSAMRALQEHGLTLIKGGGS